ncbi:hypothetical protein BGZ57DRAFT_932373 [Hyaloscypha finlandica]|nr:hypothetical protein BGZ57DRAFT_932373 [Hyaloscypha finlandica]
MHTIEQSTFEDSCSAKKHASYHHITRSVPGMKSLLPLRLLSPVDVWPSSAPPNRSTFGMNIVSTDEDEDGSLPGKVDDGNDLESRAGNHRLKPYRDVPIYSEPGSPLLNRAYLTDEEVHSNCSTSESEEWFEVYDYLGMEREASECVDESSTIKGPIEDEVEDDLKTISEPSKHRTSPMDRSSAMSFQCSGEAEALFSNEAAWLRSPLSYHHPGKASRLPLRDSSVPFEQNVESWLSDTSSCGDDREDLLSRATCLAPVKAHVIDVNSNRPSDLSIQVPPRSSSLVGTTIIHVPSENNRDSWLYSAYSPPATPSQPWTCVQTSSSNPNLFEREFDPHMPKRRLDLAMTSPPDSPTHGYRDALGAPPTWRTPTSTSPEQKAYGGGQPTHADQAGLDAESINNILTALENLTSHLPSGTLQPDTPCIRAIRSQLIPPSATYQQSTPANALLLHPFPHPSPPPPDITLNRRKTTNFSKPRRMPSVATSKSCPVPRNPPPPTPSLPNLRFPHATPNYQQPLRLPPPDTQPLHRIFPKSSKFMRSTLYAYILAHIFVTSLSTPPGHETPRFPKKRRDTPYWPATDVPSKAADLLGIAYHQPVNEDIDFNNRVEGVKDRIRKAIAGLAEEMEVHGCREGFDAGEGLVFIKSLEEVVRGCEVDAYRSF